MPLDLLDQSVHPRLVDVRAMEVVMPHDSVEPKFGGHATDLCRGDADSVNGLDSADRHRKHVAVRIAVPGDMRPVGIATRDVRE
jgi:hypothetical protein